MSATETTCTSGLPARLGARLLLVGLWMKKLTATPQLWPFPGYGRRGTGWELLHGDGRTIATSCCTFPRKLYRSSLTSNVILHSPARGHSNSHAQHRHSMSSQVRTGQDSNLRSYNTSSARARPGRMSGPGNVPYPRAGLSNQKRIRSLQQIPTRRKDGGVLWWHSNGQRCRAVEEQGAVS